MSSDPFARPDPEADRAKRAYTALFQIAERHASMPERRWRHVHPQVLSPHEAVRMVVVMASGTVPPEEGEPPADVSDLAAALTLMPHARSELDEFEAALLRMARGRGMTWQDIAYGLGLGSAQAARQRYERLLARTPGPAEHPGNEPGGHPGSEPGKEPGSQPGNQPGTQRGNEPAAQPSNEPAAQPSNEPGNESATDPREHPREQADDPA